MLVSKKILFAYYRPNALSAGAILFKKKLGKILHSPITPWHPIH